MSAVQVSLGAQDGSEVAEAVGRYNAAKTIEGSAPAARELDLDTLSAELLAVVDQVMEPTTVSLWLRPLGTAPQTS